MAQPNAHDFYDPAIAQARFVAEQVTRGVNEDTLISHGAKKFANWEFKLDAEATLKTLERIVKEESLGKVFGDGAVFDAIPDERVANVSFYKLEDGSGVAIAQLTGGNDAMRVLLSKADLSDLDLAPKMPTPKPVTDDKVEGKLSLEGTDLVVEIRKPATEVAPTRPIAREAMGGSLPLNTRNPVALKEMLLKIYGADQQSIPMPKAEFLATASIIAACSAHPDDDAWPAGVTVRDLLNEGNLDSPRRAMAVFTAAVEEREGPVIERADVAEQFRKRKQGGPR